MIVVLPISVRLLQERQDIRRGAAGGVASSAPLCDSGDSSRTYGECCGCKMTQEVRECTRPNGTKYWRKGACNIPVYPDDVRCDNTCPTPTLPPPTGTTCAGGVRPGQLACLDANSCKLCQSNGLYTNSTSCDCPTFCRPRTCPGSPPPSTPAPTPTTSRCQQQNGTCFPGECPSGTQALCVVGQDCFGFCGHDYSVCCLPTPTPRTSTPAPTPCRCTEGLWQGERCDPLLLNKPCVVASTPAPTPIPTRTPCRCIDGFWRGDECDPQVLDRTCGVTPTPTPPLECVCRDGILEGRGCESWMVGKECGGLVQEDCVSLGGECRFFALGCRENWVANNEGRCSLGQRCCVRARDCGSLKHQETICEGRDGYRICVNGNIESRSCGSGLFCQYVQEEGAKCTLPSLLTPTPTPFPLFSDPFPDRAYQHCSAGCLPESVGLVLLLLANVIVGLGPVSVVNQ